jgi:hypothetical protein
MARKKLRGRWLSAIRAFNSWIGVWDFANATSRRLVSRI